MFVNNYIKEADGATLEAKIYKSESNGVYSIQFFINGEYRGVEEFPNKSIYYVEDAAENWLTGIKKLNG